jgi:hypothetical protein
MGKMELDSFLGKSNNEYRRPSHAIAFIVELCFVLVVLASHRPTLFRHIIDE